jgi:hypothetical protein
MQVCQARIPGVETAGGYGPPGGSQGGPPFAPGGGGYGGPPGGGASPPSGGYGGPPGGYGQGPPAGGYGAPSGVGFGMPGQLGPPPGGPRVHPLAIVSLVAGLLSMPACCCWFGLALPICAVVCGFLALGRIQGSPQVYSGTLFCYIGMACGGLGFLTCLGFHLTRFGETAWHRYGRQF